MLLLTSKTNIMTYSVKYQLRNDLQFKTTVTKSGELKDTEHLRSSLAQAHYYDFNNHISCIDIVSVSIQPM